jgi:hypothetical protein
MQEPISPTLSNERKTNLIITDRRVFFIGPTGHEISQRNSKYCKVQYNLYKVQKHVLHPYKHESWEMYDHILTLRMLAPPLPITNLWNCL